MKTTKRTLWIGAILFSLGLGCGNDASSSQTVNADTLAVSGSAVSGEQLALPDCDGKGAMDKAGPVQKNELDDLKSLLNLTADQIAQVQPILDATRSALEDLRAQVKAGTVTPADAQAKAPARSKPFMLVSPGPCSRPIAPVCGRSRTPPAASP